jgi:hypothetical protein
VPESGWAGVSRALLSAAAGAGLLPPQAVSIIPSMEVKIKARYNMGNFLSRLVKITSIKNKN